MASLTRFAKSGRENKKFVASFEDEQGRGRTVHFGDSRYEDYTQHRDRERRARYRARHARDVGRGAWPLTPGALSLYVLWGDSTSVATNLRAYLRRFKIKDARR